MGKKLFVNRSFILILIQVGSPYHPVGSYFRSALHLHKGKNLFLVIETLAIFVTPSGCLNGSVQADAI